jgi:hypothetical protein
MRKSHASLLILLFLTFLVTLQPVLLASADSSWNVQMLQEYVWGGGSCPIVVGLNDTVHVAYLDGYTLICASYNGSAWTNRTIATDQIYIIFNLVLDHSGYPHLLYEQKWVGNLKLANWNGESWSIQDTGISSDSATVAFDYSGNPHIVYPTYTTVVNDHNDWAKNSVNTALNYASWTGVGWSTRTIDRVVNGSFPTVSLEFNTNNAPYILYSPSTDSSIIKLATYQNSNWQSQTAQLPPSTGNCGNIVLDSEGYPHFLCTQPYQNSTTLSTILYATFNQTTWNTQTAASKVSLGTVGELVLDSHDNPHFTFGTSAGDTMYVAYSGRTWNIKTLDSNIEVGNLALDSSGNPHLLYRAYSPARFSSKLMYATATGVPSTSSEYVSKITAQNLTIVTAVAVLLAAVISILIYKRYRRHAFARQKTDN